METTLKHESETTKGYDRLVYGLYGLTAEEVEVVEGMG